MILLDTDHPSVFEIPDTNRRARPVARLAMAAGEVGGTTVITVEEQTRGWLTAIAKERQPHRQIPAYRRLAGLFEFFRAFHIALFDETAADLFSHCSSIRIGAMGRKIATVVISNKAMLLTANRQDFELVPGLRFENWLDS